MAIMIFIMEKIVVSSFYTVYHRHFSRIQPFHAYKADDTNENFTVEHTLQH